VAATTYRWLDMFQPVTPYPWIVTAANCLDVFIVMRPIVYGKMMAIFEFDGTKQ
jgi:hypothetical protein